MIVRGNASNISYLSSCALSHMQYVEWLDGDTKALRWDGEGGATATHAAHPLKIKALHTADR